MAAGTSRAPRNSARPAVPFSILLSNRQKSVPLDLRYIRRIGEKAYPLCLEAATGKDVPLRSLDGVEVTILTNREIGRVHADFLEDPEPTDVITFHHGEIVIGAGIIRDNAREYGHRPTDEAALCVVHGLLHLAGWNDLTAREARKMAVLQEQIFNRARQML